MSMFGMSPAMQAMTNFPVQSREVGKIMSPPPKQAASGWDAFLSGASKIAGNFATGVMAGLQGYDPRNEYSSLAAGYIGATRGLQTQADIEDARMRHAAGMQMRAQDVSAELSAKRAAGELQAELASQKQLSEERDWRRQVEGASILPSSTSGISTGVAAPKPQAAQKIDDLDVLVGDPSTWLPASASSTVSRLIGVKR